MQAVKKTGRRIFADLVRRETKAATAACDKREHDADTYGYGRAPGEPIGEVVGLEDYIPERK